MTETQFKKCVLKDLAEFEECYVLKTQERGRKGVPDLIICYRGKFVAIEPKRDGESPTPLQMNRLEAIRKAKGIAFSTTPRKWPGDCLILKGLAHDSA